MSQTEVKLVLRLRYENYPKGGILDNHHMLKLLLQTAMFLLRKCFAGRPSLWPGIRRRST